MSVLMARVRQGRYADSIVLMQVQAALVELPGVLDAGAVMATPENRALLAAGDLTPPEDTEAGPSDLLIVVRAQNESAAEHALDRVDALLVRSGGADGQGAGDYRPRSLRSALALVPEARWAVVSVPGRFAERVAREALDRNLHVFLYSDNVPVEEEIALKTHAASAGLLLMGPDCGTACVHGLGLGFANRVREGTIGLVGASGTGLQAIASHIHALGGGVSHAIGTGGRDLDARVGGITCRHGLDLLARDPGTEVIVLVSKPPAPSMVRTVLATARGAGKPIVVCFLDFSPPARRIGSVYFAAGLSEAAWMAVELSKPGGHARFAEDSATDTEAIAGASGPGFLRGLFSGGTLAFETLVALRSFIEPLHSNLAAPGVQPLTHGARSAGHTVLDLGGDEYTAGRLHPMIDNDLRLRRITQEAADPEVGVILLDVVLGDGAHPDPAGELAPAIAAARSRREVEFVAVVIGTDEDPQNLDDQRTALRDAGAHVFEDLASALSHVVERVGPRATPPEPRVELEALTTPVVAINVGLESFAASLEGQGARVVHVEWRPPAGGDERLMSILERMRR